MTTLSSRYLIIGIVAAVLSAAAVAEAVPLRIAHQGSLSNEEGLVTGEVEITFRLFDDATSGTAVWTETTEVDTNTRALRCRHRDLANVAALSTGRLCALDLVDHCTEVSFDLLWCE